MYTQARISEHLKCTTKGPSFIQKDFKRKNRRDPHESASSFVYRCFGSIRRLFGFFSRCLNVETGCPSIAWTLPSTAVKSTGGIGSAMA
jgi:hypothetical protein